MIGAIAGDIIGSRFEGHPAPPAAFQLFHRHCRFTDDTVCTLAVAEAMMAGADYAATLRAHVRRYPHAGYGGMFRDWALRDGAPAYGSWGNGAPMRVAAAGWLAESAEAADAEAAAQARVSHDHPSAVVAAQAVAAAIFALRSGATVAFVRDWIAGRFGYDLDPAQALRGGGFDISAAGTVPPALVCAFEAQSWEGAVRAAIGLGGDTDTLACIAGAVAEAIHGVPDTVAAQARAHLTDDLAEILARFDAATGAGRD
ncbi:MAG: ADP-ribosylglycohydrolase family protein [Planctomycetes bacterium]|jgi:ADP-ribosylglycohydrolase|nr:ADP-ribosylglycohydrolase family protein [Planctomycetota bacterium]